MNCQIETLVQKFLNAGKLCRDDEQFRRSTEFWTGSLRVGVSGQSVIYRIEAGQLVSVTQTANVVEEGDNEFGFEALMRPGGIFSQDPQMRRPKCLRSGEATSSAQAIVPPTGVTIQRCADCLS
ncbi:MAG: hypothetical protein Ct9H300mP26_2280 [Acidimicrobiales bacterium]|nr:MAG: hypothetical protein Ct9H300mP26_2280 [Acidimicrobiales bacterium]